MNELDHIIDAHRREDERVEFALLIAGLVLLAVVWMIVKVLS